MATILPQLPDPDALAAFATQPWPWLCLALVGAVLLFGGERLLRPGAVVLAVGLGSIGGGLLASRIAPSGIAGAPSWLVGGIAGVVLGVVVAAALWRAAVAAASCAVVAIACVLGTAVHLGLGAETVQPSEEALAAYTDTARGSLMSSDPDAAALRVASRRAAAITGAEAARAWSSLPAESRASLAGSLILGGLAGLLVGGLMPRVSGAAMTAATGGAVLLGSLAALWNSQGWQVPMHPSAGVVLAAWAGVTLVGLTSQIAMSRKKAPAPAPATAA
ncbi:MAG: hypothetical protein IT433_11570 [Phycisphaerales bacterium]|nr:hypothetical protein [Phycisphaerales bacterium]